MADGVSAKEGPHMAEHSTEVQAAEFLKPGPPNTTAPTFFFFRYSLNRPAGPIQSLSCNVRQSYVFLCVGGSVAVAVAVFLLSFFFFFPFCPFLSVLVLVLLSQELIFVLIGLSTS